MTEPETSDYAQRESAWDSWGQPETLADYLYEMRFRLEKDKSISRASSEDDYRPLYEKLNLSQAIPYADFLQVALAEAEPSQPLLMHLYRYVAAHHNKPTVDVFRTVASHHLKAGEVLSLHPYYLTALLKDNLPSDAAFYRAAQELNIYPSMLRALMEGDLVAPKELREKLCRYFKFDEATNAAIQQSGLDYMAQVEQESPRKAFLMRHFAATDRSTSLAYFMQTMLYQGSLVRSEDIIEAMNGNTEPLDMVLADMREKVITRIRRNYEAQTVRRLAQGLALDKPLAALFEEMGTGRSFGTLLEEYVLAGGRSWSGCIDSILQDWSVGVVQFSKRTGLDVQAVIGWVGNDSASDRPSRPNRKSLEKLADNVGLNPKQRDYLFALALGDLSQGVEIADIVHESQEQMKQMHGLHARELYGSVVLDRLLRRSGHNGNSLKGLEGIGPAIINRQRQLANKDAEFDYSHPFWVKSSHIVAKALCPDQRTRLAHDMAMLFQGVAETKTPSELLKEVQAGLISVGDVVKHYRIQQKFAALDMMERMGMVRNTQSYNVCEEAPNAGLPSSGLIQALAHEMKLDEKETELFARAMRGEPMQGSQILDVLDQAIKGEALFSDVLAQILKEKYQPKMVAGSIGLGGLAADLGVAHSDTARWFKGRRHIRQPELAKKLATIAGIPPERLEDFLAVAQDKIPTYNPDLLAPRNSPPDAQQRYELFQTLRANARLSTEECAELIGTNATSLRRSFISNGCSWNLKAPLEKLAELLIHDDYPEHRQRFCEWFGPLREVETSKLQPLEYQGTLKSREVSRAG